MIRATAVCSGRVQGVGFRAHTVALAESAALSGFVRNQPDGTVLLVVEGEEADVRRFLGAVARFQVGASAPRLDVVHGPATGGFTDFHIQS